MAITGMNVIDRSWHPLNSSLGVTIAASNTFLCVTSSAKLEKK